MGQKKMNEMEHVTHEFQPIYDKNSKVLMLGTMPSPKSREVGFYYGHPRNRFWKVVSAVWRGITRDKGRQDCICTAEPYCGMGCVGRL